MLSSINFFGLTLYLYPFFWGLGWSAALFYLIVFGRSKNVFLLFSVLFLAGWIGGKIFYVFFEEPALSLFALDTYYSTSGFVFYGGFFFTSFLILILSRIFPLVRNLIPVIVCAAPLGHAVGRLGCLAAGCCYGGYCELLGGAYPVPLFESLGLFVIFIYLHRKRAKNKWNSKQLVYLCSSKTCE
jgi:phosphatidylglycerol:prolipoprotein diacylglycerol transferase